MSSYSRNNARKRRQRRVRKKIKGTSEKPRLCVFRSSRHIFAQIIDDTNGTTLVSASTLSKDLDQTVENLKGNKSGSALIGELIAKKALDAGINNVVFDRNGFLYHGRIKALANAVRENGIKY